MCQLPYITQCGLSYWLFFSYSKQLQSYGRTSVTT